MTEYSGADLYLAFAGNAISGHQRSFSTAQSINLIDGTTAADTHRTFVTGIKNTTATIEIVDQAGGTVYGYLDRGTNGTIEWGPEGTATGQPKYTATATISQRSTTHPYEDIVSITADVQFTSDITAATY